MQAISSNVVYLSISNAVKAHDSFQKSQQGTISLRRKFRFASSLQKVPFWSLGALLARQFHSNIIFMYKLHHIFGTQITILQGSCTFRYIASKVYYDYLTITVAFEYHEYGVGRHSMSLLGCIPLI